MDLINYLLGLPDSDLPSVLTTSYGDDEQSVSYEYASRVCRGYAALGTRYALYRSFKRDFPMFIITTTSVEGLLLSSVALIKAWDQPIIMTQTMCGGLFAS